MVQQLAYDKITIYGGFMAKKKPKNSDYNYSKRKEIEKEIREKKQAAKEKKRKASLIHTAAIFMLLVAFGLAIAGTLNKEKTYFAVICGLLTGLGMTTLSFYYMPIKKSAGKLCFVLGIVMLVATLIAARQLGYFGI